MGEKSKSAANNRYYSIVQGDFVRRVPVGHPDAVERTNKLGNVVHEIHVNAIDGTLTDLHTKDGDYGLELIATVSDKDGNYIIQMPFKSSTAKIFMTLLPNVDFSKPLEISVAQTKKEDGKTRDVLFVKQDGTNIKWAYTKANPNGLPPMVEKTKLGKKEWDDTDQLEFFLKSVAELSAKISSVKPAVENVAEEEIPIGKENEGDLPF